jgi:diguanylate cyclase (GGDEF)-like protein
VTTWLLTSGLYRIWIGELDTAGALLAQAHEQLAKFAHITLGHAFAHWVGAELAWARHDLQRAVHECNVLVDMSQRLEYEQMACLGHLLVSQVHEVMNEPAKAVDALRKLRSREAVIRAESVHGRERAVQWHLDLRLMEKNVRQLEGMSRHLERLSLEDSLTGLANRRCLEQTLESVLAARSTHGAPMSLAFIDVDKFKHVNDLYSHHIGDLVLKAIAGILLQATRENDLAARLAGDEFAILFQRADAIEAARVCRRIAAAVADHAWVDIAPGLSVTVSIGTATARDGDSSATLLHRGDSEMYAVKRATAVSGHQR